MADQRLSDKGTTAVISGGYIHIIIPDAGSPSGYTSYRISTTDLHAALQADIDDNASDITTLSGQVSALENLLSRSKYSAQVSNFQHSQPGDSTVRRIEFKSAAGVGTNTVKVGTSAGADDIMTVVTLSNDEDTPYIFDSPLYASGSRTIYFTITGAVTAVVYQTLDDY